MMTSAASALPSAAICRSADANDRGMGDVSWVSGRDGDDGIEVGVGDSARPGRVSMWWW